LTHPTAKPDPLLVSDTGRWAVSRLVAELKTDSHDSWATRAALGVRLGIRNDAQLQRIWGAMQRVARDRRAASLILPARGTTPKRLLIVRPAREPNLVALIMENVDEAPPAPPPELLVDLFGLTPAECDVASALLRGEETVAIALARGNSSETVRGHVKSILRKTGSGSQRQLTTILARIGMLAGSTVAETLGD
jgi:DNA-binding NarL/FixJ family response regulator